MAWHAVRVECALVRDDIQPGALVECTDGPLGTVEQVLTDQQSGKRMGILVRHGRADYLLSVPARYIATSAPWRVQLSAPFAEVEAAAIEAGRAPGGRERIADGGPTEPTPYEEETLGTTPGGSQPGGPSTS